MSADVVALESLLCSVAVTEEKGLISPQLALETHTEYGHIERKVICAQPIKRGDVLMRIPTSMCLTALDSSLFPDASALVLSHTNLRVLALLRAHNISAGKYWNAYVTELLPKHADFVHMPLFWSDAELANCGSHSMVAKTTRKLRAQINFCFTNLSSVVASSDVFEAKTKALFTLPFVEWAFLCMNSRSFSSLESKKRTEGKQPTSAAALTSLSGDVDVVEHMYLVPLADFLNHAVQEDSGCNVLPRLVRDKITSSSSSKPTEHEDESAVATTTTVGEEGEEDGVEMEYWEVMAIRDIAKGKEVKFEYRKGANSFFLCYYGFVLDENDNDCVFMTVPFKPIIKHKKLYYGEPLSPATLDKLTVADLKTALKERDALLTGKKLELRNRLSAILTLEAEQRGESPADMMTHTEEILSPTLAKALVSMDLPAALELAIPVTKETTLPMAWVWALRLQRMSEEQLESFIAGQVKLTLDQETSVWHEINDTLKRAFGEYVQSAVVVRKSGIDTSKKLTLDEMKAHAWEVCANGGMSVLKASLAQAKTVGRRDH